MSQQKKEYIALHIKMDAPLMRRLEEYCDEVGQTKTMAVERIVGSFLDKRDLNITPGVESNAPCR